MSVADIFEVLKNSSMSIGVSDGKLKIVDPLQKLTPELREQIRNSKDEILRILSRQDCASISDFPHATLAEGDFQQIREAHPDVANLYPATALQKGMFYHESFAGRETCYSRQIYFDMDGQLDLGKLDEAWRTVCDRHEMLRSCFVGFAANEVHQLVVGQCELPLSVIDQQHAPETEQRAYLAQLRAQQRAQRFDLAKPPLMRIHLVRLSPERTHFLWTYHHAILDGWSIPLVLDEVTRCYEALVKGGEAGLEPAIPYARYVDWLAGQDHDAAEAYWKNYLASYPLPRRPLFPPAPSSEGAAAGEVPVALDPALGGQLASACARMHCTMNTMLHLAWAYALGRYLDCDDIVVGSATAVRPAEIGQAEKMIGLLINTVPVRVRFEPGLTLREALARLRQDSAESADFRYFPLEKMQAALGGPGKAPLVESMLVFQNYPDYGKADGARLAQNIVLANTGYSDENNFAIVLTGSMVGEHLALHVAYDARVSAGLARELARYLELTLQRLVQAEPDAALLGLDGAPAAVAAPAHAAAPLITATVDARAGATPRAQALTYDFESLSYQQLVEKSNRLAHYLAESGVRPGAAVAVLMDRSNDLGVALLATLKAGAAYLLLDASEPDERIRHKLAHAQARFILTNEQTEERCTSFQAAPIVLNAPKVAKAIARCPASPPQLAAATDAAAIAYIHYQSSPAGYPEPVRVPHGTLARMVAWHNARGAAGAGERVLCGASVLLERCSLELFGALCNGAEILLANDVLDLCINPDLAPTTMSLAADDLHRLLDRRYDFSGVRTLTLYDGEHCMATIARLFDRAAIEFVDLYLSSPACALACGAARVGRGELKAPRFESIDGHARFAVLDRFGRPQPAGALGQLHLATERGLLATGDTVRGDADGRIELVRRNPHHFEVAGYRADYREVEFQIGRIAGVDACAVLMRDDGHAERLVAYLVLTSRFTGSANHYADDEQYFDEVHRCKQQLLGTLPALLVPEVYVFLEELPHDANGSVDKEALPSPEEVSNERRNFVAPKNAIEETLLTLWEGGFLLNGISCEDNYFELGGSSLLQVKLGARINQEFGTSLPLADLFHDRATVVTQAERIAAALAAADK